MKVEQLSLADYNKIKNIPVVNQDLSASGFTPVANTYYRHTGTTDTYKQGVIYYYDGTEYKALDGAGGGGTTLNKYTYTANLANPTYAMRSTIRKIVGNAPKYNASIRLDVQLSNNKVLSLYGEMILGSNYYGYSGVLYTTDNYIAPVYIVHNDTSVNVLGFVEKNGTISTFTEQSTNILTVVYYNDTEITA